MTEQSKQIELEAENAKLRAALLSIMNDHANFVYQMGDARCRRALVDIYEVARGALKEVQS